MSQKSDAPVLILSLLVSLGLLGAGGWWVYRYFRSEEPVVSQPAPDPLSPVTEPTVPEPAPEPVTPSRLSTGGTLLFSSGASAEKRAAIEAIASGDYVTAIENLETTLARDRNDPEARIYLNNAEIGTQSAYTVAVVVPGPTATDVSLELLRGVAQAQAEINGIGGIEGIPLQVAIAIDNNDETQAKTVAESISQQPGMLGVIGHFSSDVSIAAAEVYEANSLVMISPTSTSVQLSGAGDYIFRTVQSDRLAGDGLAQHMLNTMGVRNVAVFYNSQSAYSFSLKEAFNSAVWSSGGRVVSEIDLAAEDFSAARSVADVAQQGAEVLMLAANTPTRSEALEVISANRQQFKLLGGDSLYNAEILKVGQTDVVDMVIAAAWHRDGTPNAIFPQAAEALWGGPVSWRTAMAYDATQSLIAAMLAADQPPDLLTSTTLQQVLASASFNAVGAADMIEFLPSGDRSLPPQLVTIERDAASKFGYSFVPLP